MTRTSLTGGALLLAAVAIASCHENPTDPTPVGSRPDGPDFVAVTTPNTFTQVTARQAHSCARRSDGVVECWGASKSTFGQAPATKVAVTGTFVEVRAGSYHSCALRSDGVVECWGAEGSVGGVAPPTVTATTGAFTQLSAGESHNCALRGDGIVECWGAVGTHVDYGQSPATKSATSGVFTQVSAGAYHTCARRNDGVVECWGAGLGVPAPPIKTAASGTFVEVSSGADHSCALRDDGVVECWGYSGFGQAPATKAAVTGTFTQVSVGAEYTCGLRNDGVVECWGHDAYGQAPATRSATSGSFTQVAAGHSHTCALRTDGVVECWGYDGQGQAPATKSASGGSTTVHYLPQADFSATPNPVALGQSFTLALSDAEVEVPGSHTFNYAFDCGDGGGYGSFGPSSTGACPTSAIGTRNVRGTVRDEDGDQTEYTGSVTVIHAFGGFTGTVDAPPVFNLAKAGSAIPVKFSLGGNQGLNILAAGYPTSQPIACDASAPTDPIEQTVAAGNSSLSYDATTGLYTYVWKTNKAWANTCRLLTLRLVDGTDHTALFKF